MENPFRDGFLGMAWRAFNGPVLADLDSQIRNLRNETNRVVNLDEIPAYQVDQWPTRTGIQQVLIPRENLLPKETTFHVGALVDYDIGNLLWERFKWSLMTGVESGAIIGVPVAIVAGYFHWV